METPAAAQTCALQMGQDFLPNHELPDIDFATTHIWPDNWKKYVFSCMLLTGWFLKAASLLEQC